MTFPATPLDVTVELFVDAAWTGITSDVLSRDDIVITRGRSDAFGTSQASTLSLTLDNRSGKYSPWNPTGPYYGKIGRNTPIRVTLDGSLTRFTGEISSWPAGWDTSTKDAWMSVQAAGILRRIGQGNQPSGTGLKQLLLGTSPITYWPLDDGASATSGAPAAGSYRGSTFHPVGTLNIKWGVGDLAPYMMQTLQLNTLPLPYGWVTGFTTGSQATPNALAWDFVYRPNPRTEGTLPNMGTWAFQARVDGASGKDEWEIQFRGDGANDDIALELHLDVYGLRSDVALANTAPLAAITDGLLHHVRLQLTQNGANVDYVVYVDGASVISGTRNTHTLRRAYDMAVEHDVTSTQDLLAVGHLIVWEQTANIPAVATVALAAAGYAGETAGRRFERLCAETGTPFLGTGDLDDTLAMGLQYTDYFENQLTEIEATDRGLIYEPRATFALGYRTRASMYNQAPLATISYSSLQLAAPFEPVEDDANIRNDVFAQRREGSSYQATQGTGPLSVQDPPNGVGRYKDEVQVNVKTDAMLPEIAGWLLALGTVDEPRYTQITVDLATPGVAGNATLVTALMAAEIGYPITITGTRALSIYDDIKLLVIGYTETLNNYTHRISFNCVPYSPYEVLEFDLADSRIDPGDESTLSSGVTSTATSLSVASAGFLWTTAGGDLPVSIMVDGEEMTVTAISGASSPQTFTVIRSVNSVVKSHSIGAVIRLKRPGVTAL